MIKKKKDPRKEKKGLKDDVFLPFPTQSKVNLQVRYNNNCLGNRDQILTCLQGDKSQEREQNLPHIAL